MKDDITMNRIAGPQSVKQGQDDVETADALRRFESTY
jgi:hypothetical protein